MKDSLTTTNYTNYAKKDINYKEKNKNNSLTTTNYADLTN